MNQEDYVKRMTLWSFDIGCYFGSSVIILILLLVSLIYLSAII